MSEKQVIKDHHLWMFDYSKTDQISNMMNVYYNDSSRYYHTANHILDCYKTFEKITSGIGFKYRTELYTAILFHDIIYRIPAPPGANERQSSEMCQSIGRLFFNKERPYKIDWGVVDEIIMSTAHTGDQIDLIESKYMINIDLYQLGTDDYFTNAELIKNEYLASYNEIDFNIGRIQFLKSMLNRTDIYYKLDDGSGNHMINDLLFNHLELKARRYMSGELVMLEDRLKTRMTF